MFEYLYESIFSFFQIHIGSIAANIVASVIIFSFGYILGSYYSWKEYFKKMKISRFIRPNDPIVMFIGTSNKRNIKDYYISRGDYYSVLEVRNFLERNFPKCKVTLSDIYSVGDFASIQNSNLILIGGPFTNELCEMMFKSLHNDGELGFSYTRDSISFKDRKFEVSLDRYGKVDEVYGIIYKAPNPFKSSCYIIVIAGLMSFGTLSAARVFSDDHTFIALDNHVVDKDRFIVLVKGTVVNDMLGQSRIIDWK